MKFHQRWQTEGHLITLFCCCCGYHHPRPLFLRSVNKWLIAHSEMIKYCLTFPSFFCLMFCSWVLANLRFPNKEKPGNYKADSGVLIWKWLLWNHSEEPRRKTGSLIFFVQMKKMLSQFIQKHWFFRFKNIFSVKKRNSVPIKQFTTWKVTLWLEKDVCNSILFSQL